MKEGTIVLMLALFFCQLCVGQGKNNPNLSEERIKELLSDSALFPKREVMTNITIPAGIKYEEIRGADPAEPPVIIDIAGNLNNKKTFKLSDIAKSVRYVILQPPPGIKFTAIDDMVSDDTHIFVNTRQGLFCYSPQGQYLYTAIENYWEERLYSSILIPTQISGTLKSNNIDLLNGKLIARIGEDGKNVYFSVFDVREMDAQLRFMYQTQELKSAGAKPEYKRQLTENSGVVEPAILLNDDQSLFGSNLTVTSLYGDTLCKFTDYDTYKLRPGQGGVPNVRSKAYRFDGRIMLQKALNDTVFRFIPPNRFIPTYVMRWGAYKMDNQTYMTLGSSEGKLIFSEWIECERFIFIKYYEGSKTVLTRDKITYRWAVYDKVAKTLTHCLETGAHIRLGKSLDPIPPLFDNDIEPVGMPFFPEGVNHRNEMYMIFSKIKLKNLIETGRYRNDKLQAIHDNMPEDSFLLMLAR